VVYLTLAKEGGNPYSVHADYLSTIKRHQIAVDLTYLMPEKINGNYRMTLFVEDPRAEQPLHHDLGVFQVNFVDGNSEGDNLRVREDFKLLDEITNYFPPEEPQKQPTVPLAFSGVLVVMFLIFVGQVFANQGNLTNLTFFGLLFVLNYLLVLGVIVAFWIEINLVNTLWILLALSPITLVTMNAGLVPELCEIQPFFLKQSPAKAKNQ
jgi:hypothetical protein